MIASMGVEKQIIHNMWTIFFSQISFMLLSKNVCIFLGLLGVYFVHVNKIYQT